MPGRLTELPAVSGSRRAAVRRTDSLFSDAGKRAVDR
jgi:hypothetical protein